MRRFPLVVSATLALGMAGCANSKASRENATPTGPSVTVPFKSFAVYSDRSPRNTHYVASGYMGDSDLSLSGAYIETPSGSQAPCLRVNYKAKGVKGWTGLYWQDPANNWGEVPGRAGYDLRGAERLTFYARGEKGGERVHEFRIGGIVGQYPDSDVASLSNVRLTKEWKQYTINLKGKDLRHIIGGFGILLLKTENPGGATFYLNNIVYEGPESQMTPTPASGTVSAAVVETVVTPPPPPVVPPAPVPVKSKDMQVEETEAGLKVSFSSRVLFASGKSVLADGSSRVLNQLIGLLTAYPSNRVLIEGHTDKSGAAEFNLKLSELRAKSVRDFLIKQGGFDESRFQIVGYGATKPIADNNTPAGRLLNRRVEVTILKDVKK